MEINAACNWKHDPTTKLIYLGRNWSGNGYWHQFALAGDSERAVWCEIKDSDMHLMEESAPSPKDEVPWTPGETWTVHDCGGSTMEVISSHQPDQRRAQVCVVYFDYTDKDDEVRQKARARMISESPTMAALLERLLVAMKWRTHSLTEDERTALADAQELVKRHRRGK